MDPQEHLRILHAIPQHPQRSDEWFAQRMGRLTSSDAGTILGINPYQKPVEVLLRKCGAPLPFTGNSATLHGQKYEAEAIDMYSKALGKKNYEFGLIDYDSVARPNDPGPKSIPWLAGSTDGVAEDVAGLEKLVLLEVKCPYRRKVVLGKIPEYYYPQVQLNMAILNIDKADFIEYKPSTQGTPFVLNIVRIQRSHKWLSENLPILEDFWNQVLLWRQRDIREHPEYRLYVPQPPVLRNPPMFIRTESDEES